MMTVLVIELFVDLVGNDIHVLLFEHGGQRLQLAAGVYRARGVARIVDEHGLGLSGKRRLEFGGRHLKVVFRLARHEYGHALAQLDQFGIGQPIGRGHDHLVAGVYDGGERVEKRVFGAVAHHYVLRFVR